MPTTADTEFFLGAAWRETCLPFGSIEAVSLRVFADLEERHSEASRFYHTFAHVAALLRTLGTLRTQIKIPSIDAVLLAAWFHDAVYDTQAHDNEEQSAALAAAQLPELGVPEAQIRIVERLILATKTHQASPGDIGCQALLDADLAILGANAADYELYVQAVRREYARVTEKDWRTGRGKVLRSLLARERIFQTPPMFRLVEDQARQNLRQELDSLT